MFVMDSFQNSLARTPDWSPFIVHSDPSRLIAPRPLRSPDGKGIGDRLRTAAFAEVQAEAAFLWAADTYIDAPLELREAWRLLAAEERKHRNWLISRMEALNVGLDERPVSDVLWHSLVSRATAQEFCQYMADAEERGRRAGERFCEVLRAIDPITGEIFGQIAHEEKAHIALARRFFTSQS